MGKDIVEREAEKKYGSDFYNSLQNLPQLVGDLTEEELFSIPWGIDRCSGNICEAVFFIRKTIENNWSRTLLMYFLDTDLYERQGKAISNFKYSLPEPQSDLAQELTKDPYNFDFLSIQEDYNEKQLKDALVNNVIKFMLELVIIDGADHFFEGEYGEEMVEDACDKIASWQ